MENAEILFNLFCQVSELYGFGKNHKPAFLLLSNLIMFIELGTVKTT